MHVSKLIYYVLQTYWKATHPDIRAVPPIARPLPQEASPSADPARLGPTPPGKGTPARSFGLIYGRIAIFIRAIPPKSSPMPKQLRNFNQTNININIDIEIRVTHYCLSPSQFKRIRSDDPLRIHISMCVHSDGYVMYAHQISSKIIFISFSTYSTHLYKIQF